jgi:DNA repair protein RadA
MQLAITAQLPIKDGGLEGKVLFIDTEGTFAPQRVYQIAKAKDLEPEKFLEGIFLGRLYNSDHQVLAIDRAFKLCQEEKIRLIIVDSVLSHFRSEYIGREARFRTPFSRRKLSSIIFKSRTPSLSSLKTKSKDTVVLPISP